MELKKIMRIVVRSHISKNLDKEMLAKNDTVAPTYSWRGFTRQASKNKPQHLSSSLANFIDLAGIDDKGKAVRSPLPHKKEYDIRRSWGS